MNRPWQWLESGPGDPALNMAIDEALLESAAARDVPLLRFYGWTEPAATFGYFQRYGDVAACTKLRPLIRRMTGGGLVPHDSDWTYSLIIPPTDGWYDLPAIGSYQAIHEWVSLAFAELEVVTSLSEKAWNEAPGQCFAGAEKFDLLREGRKIAGAAQRRSKQGLLIQGSVQAPAAGIDRNAWQSAMLKVCQFGRGNWEAISLSNDLKNRADFFAEKKYSREEYNQKR